MSARPVPVFLVAEQPMFFYPLALGTIQARATADDALEGRIRFMPILNVPRAPTLAVGEGFGPGIWLFSTYTWSIHRTLEISRAIKALDPRNLTVHGGPSIPKYADAAARLLEREPHMDVLVRGEGELAAAELLDRLAASFEEGRDWRDGLEEIRGITYLHPDRPGHPVRTPDRPRIEDVAALPSPYLAGLFDGMPPLMATLETNRGCPYTCAFCDWGSLTGQKIKLFDLDRVKDEIEWMARREAPNIFIADANFGIFERDLEIAEHFARMKGKHGWPRKLAPTFAKHSTERIVEIVKILRGAGIIVEANVAIQTTDPATLAVMKRKNIRTDRYEDLMSRFRSLDIPFNTDLMVNMPGQTPATFRKDLQAFLDRDVPVMIWPTLVLPNSGIADPEFRREHRVEVDEKGFVQACSSFTAEGREEMMRLRSTYFMAEAFGYLRYVIRYLQWDHGVPAADFLDALQKAIRDTPEAFPDFAPDFVFKNRTFAHGSLPESYAFREAAWTRLDEFYEAVARFAADRFGVPRDSCLETAFRANRAVIPDPTAAYPLEVDLDHDFAAWFNHRREGGTRRLAEYGPGVLRVSDPAGNSRGVPTAAANDSTIREQNWELPSDLKRLTALLV